MVTKKLIPLAPLLLTPLGGTTAYEALGLRRARAGGRDEKTVGNAVISTHLVGVPDLPSPRARGYEPRPQDATPRSAFQDRL